MRVEYIGRAGGIVTRKQPLAGSHNGEHGLRPPSSFPAPASFKGDAGAPQPFYTAAPPLNRPKIRMSDHPFLRLRQASTGLLTQLRVGRKRPRIRGEWTNSRLTAGTLLTIFTPTSARAVFITLRDGLEWTTYLVQVKCPHLGQGKNEAGPPSTVVPACHRSFPPRGLRQPEPV